MLYSLINILKSLLSKYSTLPKEAKSQAKSGQASV